MNAGDLAAVLAVSALLACLFPARRASQLNSVETLRVE
jgi:ABC-type lipoprotein release transport system permease subunit